jgi:hypothetical protein
MKSSLIALEFVKSLMLCSRRLSKLEKFRDGEGGMEPILANVLVERGESRPALYFTFVSITNRYCFLRESRQKYQNVSRHKKWGLWRMNRRASSSTLIAVFFVLDNNKVLSERRDRE